MKNSSIKPPEASNPTYWLRTWPTIKLDLQKLTSTADWRDVLSSFVSLCVTRKLNTWWTYLALSKECPFPELPGKLFPDMDTAYKCGCPPFYQWYYDRKNLPALETSQWTSSDVAAKLFWDGTSWLDNHPNSAALLYLLDCESRTLPLWLFKDLPHTPWWSNFLEMLILHQYKVATLDSLTRSMAHPEMLVQADLILLNSTGASLQKIPLHQGLHAMDDVIEYLKSINDTYAAQQLKNNAIAMIVKQYPYLQEKLALLNQLDLSLATASYDIESLNDIDQSHFGITPSVF